MKIIVVVAVALVATMACAKQRTTRSKISTSVETTAITAVADTLCGDSALATVTVSGYEKPLRSRHETMMLSNNDSLATITAVQLDITYTDVHGRTLHRRTAAASITVPPLTTRMLDLKSWDVNCVFYYHLNVPARTSSQATPYRVAITPTQLTVTRKK